MKKVDPITLEIIRNLRISRDHDAAMLGAALLEFERNKALMTASIQRSERLEIEVANKVISDLGLSKDQFEFKIIISKNPAEDGLIMIRQGGVWMPLE